MKEGEEFTRTPVYFLMSHLCANMQARMSYINDCDTQIIHQNSLGHGLLGFDTV
jgi:hypothetical protein